MPKKIFETPAYCPDIVEHVKRGESPGVVFGEIVTCFGRDLKNFARYRCGSEADADDAYQDALLAAHKYIGSFRGDAPLKNWLLKLVNTACLQKRRGRKNNPRLHVAIDPKDHPELEPLLASGGPSAEAQIIMQERIDCMKGALDELSTRDREMLLLHEGEGVSLAEIAQNFKMTVPGVKTRLFRARGAVKMHMEAKRKEKEKNLGKPLIKASGPGKTIKT